MNSKFKFVFNIFFIYFIIISSIYGKNFSNNVYVGFSPNGFSEKIILFAIKKAKTTIDIAAYSFTSKKIAVALIKAKNRGVKIRVVADKKSNNRKYTAIHYLANNRILVKLNDKYSIMHNKFMIFDHISVETGSFNYTKNAANNNAENVIYIKNQPEIAKEYDNEFNKLWNESKEIKPKY